MGGGGQVRGGEAETATRRRGPHRAERADRHTEGHRVADGYDRAGDAVSREGEGPGESGHGSDIGQDQLSNQNVPTEDADYCEADGGMHGCGEEDGGIPEEP